MEDARVIRLSPDDAVLSFEDAFGSFSSYDGDDFSQAKGKGRARRQAKKMQKIENRQERRSTRKSNRQANRSQRVQSRMDKKQLKADSRQMRKNTKNAGELERDAAQKDQENLYAQQEQDANNQQQTVDQQSEVPAQDSQQSYSQEQPSYSPEPAYAPQSSYAPESSSGGSAWGDGGQGWDSGSDEEDEEEDEGSFEGLDGESMSGLDGVTESNINPKISKIANRRAFVKGALSKLKNRQKLGQKLMDETDDHNKRVHISNKINETKTGIDSYEEEMSRLDGMLDSYASKGPDQFNEVKSAASGARKRMRLNNKLRRNKLRGKDVPVDAELNPQERPNRIDIPASSAEGTGLIGIDAQSDADADARYIDLKFSNASGMSDGTKTALYIGAGVLIAGLSIWALKKYKVI